ncbi:MAG: hypothetical protein AB7N80_07235 [Bdellovibrionales bacterium]
MKKFVLLTLAIFFSATLSAKHFWRGKTLSTQEVARQWGAAPFDAVKFKEGDEKVRAAMAHSMLTKRKEFIGKSVLEIRGQLGMPDGYYFSDVFPAYMIHRGKGANEDSWQIVFLLTNERRVDDVIVHKNCCD